MISTRAHNFLRVFLFLCVFSSSGSAIAQPFSISGRVLDQGGNPVTDAVVTLVETRQTVKADPSGQYRFDGVAPGHYHVQAESRRSGSTLADALVSAASLTIDLTVDRAVHSEEIVVSAGVDGRRGSEVYQAVNVMQEEELLVRMQPTLGETLAAQPGVSSTSFGPGASRPVVRGLGSDRVRILEDGLGTGDASSVSPDHAVGSDPSSASRIEIVRGPATLLYGSNAIGGVVNMITDRIPSRVPTAPVSGSVTARLGSVSDERMGGLELDGGAGKLAWHADFLKRDTADYEIPGVADAFDDPEDFDGLLANSSMESRSGTLGLSFIGSLGFAGVSYSGFETKYGVPGHAHHEGEDETEADGEDAVRIDLEQRRLDFRGEITTLPGFFRNVRLRAGRTDYEHVELEGAEVGTRFTNEGFEMRLEAGHRAFGRLTGAMGLQVTDNDFAAFGDEAFVPPSRTKSRAFFVFEELPGERVDLQFGARFEQQDIAPRGDYEDQSFAGLSISAGTVYRPAHGYVVAASLARAVRNPTATELFANGPHAATSQFEVGDLSLDPETSLGLDVSFRKIEGRLRGELNLFNNTFSGFIYDAPTGGEEDGLPVFAYQQRDALFRGAELDLHTEIWHSGENHLELETGIDYVRATLRDGGNVPFIPPVRASLGLRFERGVFSGLAEARRYSRQSRVANYETPTDGYTMVNASIGHRFFVGNTIHEVLLRGTNLTDVLARNHVSRLKEQAPLPGRDIALTYQFSF